MWRDWNTWTVYMRRYLIRYGVYMCRRFQSEWRCDMPTLEYVLVTKFGRRKEADKVGSWKLGWFYCFLDKLEQVRTLRVLCTSTLSVVSAITLCVRSGCLSRHRSCAWVSTPSLNELPFHGGFYPVSTPITAIRHRCSSFCTWPTYLPLSPESFSRCRLRWTTPHAPLTTYPHRPTQAGKPSGLQPPPPHSWRGSRLQSSASPACGSPWIWRAVMPDTNGWSTRWYLSCGGATARARGPNRGWIPVPGDNSGGWGPPTGSPSTPSQWCCTSSLS